MAGYDQGNANRFDNAADFPKNAAGEPQLLGSAVTPISYGHKMDGSRVKDYEGNWINYTPQPNNYVDAFETGLYNNSYLSLDGGNENTTFLLSGTNTYQKGYVPRNDFSKNAVFSKITHKLNSFINVELGVNYTISNAMNPPSTDFAARYVTNDIPRNYNTDLNKHNYRAANGGLPSQDNGDPGYTRPANDMWFNIWENTSKHTEESMRLNGKINTTVTNWFNIALEGYVDNYYITSEDKQLGTGYANSGGSYSLGHSRDHQASGKILLNFAKDLTHDIKSNLSIGGELWKKLSSYSTASTNGGLLVPGNYTLSNSVNQANADAGYSGGRQINSAYFFGETSWKDQVYISYTGRNDWASTMTYANGTGNNSYFYPSISGSWLFTESFRDKIPSWFQFGKMRLAYAETGNDFNPYSINSGFTRGGTLKSISGDLPYFGYDSNTVPNPNLKPERKKSVELGLNTSMFKNRLSLDITYYKENTFDQIMTLPVPSESGAYSNTINAGNIQNQGIEIELKTTPIKSADFKWDFDVMYTRNRGKIIDLAPGQTEYVLDGSYNYGNTRVASVAIVGGAYGVLMSDSKPKTYTNPTNPNDPNNGKDILIYNASQRAAYIPRSYVVQKVGDMNTKFFGSFTNTFTYKNFYLRTLIDVKIGGDVSSYSGRYGAAYGLFQSTMYGRDTENGGITWTSKKDGTGATYHDGIIPDGVFDAGVVVDGNNVGGMTYKQAYEKGLVEPEHASAWYYKTNSWGGGVINNNVVMENSYIGIREVVFGIDIPAKYCTKLKLKNLSIQFVGRDLGFLYNTMTNNINPFSIRSNRAGAASEWGLVPYTRTYGITVKVGL
jgi:iron complex outermembrane receptor protein